MRFTVTIELENGIRYGVRCDDNMSSETIGNAVKNTIMQIRDETTPVPLLSQDEA
jgi:hypothetical protein